MTEMVSSELKLDVVRNAVAVAIFVSVVGHKMCKSEYGP